MSNKIKKDIMTFSCFKSLNLDDDNKEKRESIDEKIKENSEFILNSYAEQSNFKEIMPDIQKVSRKQYFYNKIVKKGFKHKSPFFKIIMKAIKEVNEEKNKVIIPIRQKRYNIYSDKNE